MPRDVVAIVGGGITGWYTALMLITGAQRPAAIHILERAATWGGRISTEHVPNATGSTTLERGASRFHRGHRRLWRLLRELGLDDRARSVGTSTVAAWGAPLDGILAASDATGARPPVWQSLELYLRELMGNAAAERWMRDTGFDAFFDTFNARDGIQNLRDHFRGTTEYFVLRGGMSQLIEALRERVIADAVASGVAFHEHLQTDVTGWRQRQAAGPRWRLELGPTAPQGLRVHADRIYVALPRPALLRLRSLPADWTRRLRRELYEIPLHRIYARFPTDPATGRAWFHGQGVTTHAGPLRLCIPISRDTMMISYTEGRWAWMWRDIAAHRGLATLQEHVMRQVREVFGADVPDPLWIRSYHWDAGVHVWAPRRRARPTLFVDVTEGLAVVGEAVASRDQGWIEGALRSVEEVMAAVAGASHK